MEDLQSVEWNKEKHISTAQYFDRYFSYVVYKGEISDLEFEELIGNLASLEKSQLQVILAGLVNRSSAIKLVYKFRIIEKELPWEKGAKLITAISGITALFPKGKQPGVYTLRSAFEDLIIFIGILLKDQQLTDEIFDFCKSIMLNSTEFTFAFQLYQWLTREDNINAKRFEGEQKNELLKILIDRAKTEAGNQSIFEKFKDDRFYFSRDWKVLDKDDLYQYVNSFLSDKEAFTHFLYLFVEDTRMVNQPEKKWSNLPMNSYMFLKMITDIDEFYNKLLSFYPEEELNMEKAFWNESDKEPRSLTPINLARQFVYRHFSEENKDD